MRADIERLRQIVDSYITANGLTRGEFVARAGEGLSVFQLGHLINGKATILDLPVFAAYARGMGIPFDRLAAQCGVIGAPNDTDDRRLTQAIVDLQRGTATLSGVQRTIFLDKLDELLKLTS